jgi:hypothetical protein
MEQPAEFDREWLEQLYSQGLHDEEVLAAWNAAFHCDRSVKELRAARAELGLKRKLDDDELLSAVSRVKRSIAGANLGYKNIHAELVVEGCCVSKERVLDALRIVDPDGIEERKKRRLVRRSYTNEACARSCFGKRVPTFNFL